MARGNGEKPKKKLLKKSTLSKNPAAKKKVEETKAATKKPAAKVDQVESVQFRARRPGGQRKTWHATYRKDDAATAAKKQRAFDLKSTGASLRDIGEMLGVSHVTVKNWIDEVIANMIYPAAEAYIAIELDRLEKAQSLLTGILFSNDNNQDRKLRAMDRLVSISESRRRLLGIDKPQKLETKVTTETPPPPEILVRIERARAEQAALEAELAKEAGSQDDELPAAKS